MFKNPILLLSLLLTGGVAAWGIADTAGSGPCSKAEAGSSC
jgi:glycine betaine transporter